MGKIDPDDAEFVALAIEVDAPIWSHDKHFLKQKRVKVVTSQDTLSSRSSCHRCGKHSIRNRTEVPGLGQ
jgi:predicted nucleic acid-binding protein